MSESDNTHGKVIILLGPETFRLREYVQQYMKAAEEKYGEMNVIKISPEDIDIEGMKTELFSSAFFSTGKRIVFLDQFPFESSDRMSADKKAYAEQIAELLQKLPEDVVVICISENPDKRLRPWKQLQKIADRNASKNFAFLEDEQLTEWIRQYVAKKQGKILPAAAEFLWQYCGTNLWTLSHEVQKLIAYATEKPISEKDITTVCTPSFETVQFALSNAFSSGKQQDVMEIFHTMIESGESALTILFRDLGSIMRQFLLAKYAMENNLGAKAVGLHPFVFGKIKNVVNQFSLAHLQYMHQQLVAVDEGTKTGKIPAYAGKEDLLVFALERWIGEFFSD